MKTRQWLAVAGAWVLFGVLGRPLPADVVWLHDGRAIRGTVTSADGAAVVEIETPSGPMKFRSMDVRTIERGDPQPEAQAAPADAEAPAGPTSADSGPLTPAHRQKFAKAKADADKLDDGPPGLAIWDAYLTDSPPAPLADLARKEHGVWKERVEKDLVRFGPQWQPRQEVADRLAKADELVAQAERASDPAEAGRLFDQAAKSHPYRVDIPMKKALTYYRARDLRGFGLALGQVIRLDGDHVVARNNLGVLAAQQKHWGAAVLHLGKAGALCEDDTVLDNLDQAIAMAVADGATAAIADDRNIRQVVAAWHAAGRRVGQTRWGNAWISEQQYQTYLTENAEIDRKLASNNAAMERYRQRYVRARQIVQYAEKVRAAATSGQRTGMTTAQYQQLAEDAKRADAEIKEIEKQVKALRADNAALEKQRHVPPHAGRLVLLDADGSGRLDTVGVGGPSAPGAARPAPGLFD